MTLAINKLVKVEERQIYMTRSYETMQAIQIRALDRQEAIESRVDILEKEAPMQRLTSKWILSGVWAVVAIAFGALGKFLGIF